MGNGEVMREVGRKFFPDADYRSVQTFDEIVKSMPDGSVLARTLRRQGRKLGL